MLHLWALWAAYTLLVAPLFGATAVAYSSASASGSGSLSVDVEAASSATGSRSTNGDSCGYYAPEAGQSCRSPRTCYDCLNVELESEPQVRRHF